MIKGVNRQMIEVTDTGNPYFERALLVVRPNCGTDEDDLLREEARRLLQSTGGYGGLRLVRRRRQIRRVLFGTVSGLLGLLIGMGANGWLK